MGTFGAKVIFIMKDGEIIGIKPKEVTNNEQQRN